MLWANFFHIYQPPNWDKRIIKKVATESYRPFVNILKKNPNIKVTLNISGSLTEQLHQQGIEYLSKVKDSGKNIQITYPVHNEGRERKPSCGILKEGNKYTESGTVHCFTCNYNASLIEMI